MKHRTSILRHPWVQRFGAWAFLFFLVKGLLWLAVPAIAAWGLFQ